MQITQLPAAACELSEIKLNIDIEMMKQDGSKNTADNSDSGDIL